MCWYSFEEMVDGKVADRSGRGLDLTMVGKVSLAEGKVGQAAEFSGVGFLETPDRPELDLAAGITLECWVYPTQPGGAGRLIDKSTVGRSDGYLLDTHPDNHLRLILQPGTLNSEAQLPLNEWSHVVAAYDPEEGTERVYLNGRIVAEREGVLGRLGLNENPLRIGADSLGSSGFVGKIDEVRVYARALAPEEVVARLRGQEVYRQPPPTREERIKATPIALRDGKVQIDYPALVGKNDVVYLTPALYPFEGLPLGNGNLGVMVWNQGGMRLKFNNGSFWGAPPAAPPMQCSSGEAQLTDAPAFVEGAREFVQRLSLFEGAVLTRAETPGGTVFITTFTTEGQDLVVMRVRDPRPGPVKRQLTLSLWRQAAQLTGEGGFIAVTSPSGHAEGDPLRSTSVLAATVEGLSAEAQPAREGAITLTLGDRGPAEYTVYLACPVVKEKEGDPLLYARTMLEAAQKRGWQALYDEHKAYWASFWSKSALYLTSPEQTADYMANLWYLNMYWAGCQSRGPYCPKFNGGNFLVEQDSRSWGGSYWYQNTREMFWPLLAGNHLELVQPFVDLYWNTMPQHRRWAKELFKVGGLQVQETMALDGSGDKFANPYTFLYLTTGLECAYQFYTYAQYTADERFLREKAYPFLKEAVQFYREWAKKGPDGKYHIYPCDARETWWRVQDGHVDLVGLKTVLPILLRESQRLGLDAEQRPGWEEFLDNLADLPLMPDGQSYAPCIFPAGPPATDNEYVEKLYTEKNTSHELSEKKNCESVECDLLFPWGLAGIDSPDRERAQKTYERRTYCGCGWDPSALWAARLGLGEEALSVMSIHAQANQVWPQGFWNSPATIRWAGTLVDCPYFDSAGVQATALNEMALQSYDGRLRLWPAVPAAWTGLFRLRALPGFLVTSEVAQGQVRYALIESERGEECRLVNPWSGTLMVTGPGGFRRESGGREVRFPTQAGQAYLVQPQAEPVAGLRSALLKPERAQGPRWPGRKSADQQWRPSQRIMLGLATDGHPLRLKLESTGG